MQKLRLEILLLVIYCFSPSLAWANGDVDLYLDPEVTYWSSTHESSGAYVNFDNPIDIESLPLVYSVEFEENDYKFIGVDVYRRTGDSCSDSLPLHRTVTLSESQSSAVDGTGNLTCTRTHCEMRIIPDLIKDGGDLRSDLFQGSYEGEIKYCIYLRFENFMGTIRSRLQKPSYLIKTLDFTAGSPFFQHGPETTLTAGQSTEITVPLSMASAAVDLDVTTEDVPRMKLSNGQYASYVGGFGTDQIAFAYTVSDQDDPADVLKTSLSQVDWKDFAPKNSAGRELVDVTNQESSCDEGACSVMSNSEAEASGPAVQTFDSCYGKVHLVMESLQNLPQSGTYNSNLLNEQLGSANEKECQVDGDGNYWTTWTRSNYIDRAFTVTRYATGMDTGTMGNHSNIENWIRFTFLCTTNEEERRIAERFGETGVVMRSKSDRVIEYRIEMKVEDFDSSARYAVSKKDVEFNKVRKSSIAPSQSAGFGGSESYTIDTKDERRYPGGDEFNFHVTYSEEYTIPEQDEISGGTGAWTSDFQYELSGALSPDVLNGTCSVNSAGTLVYNMFNETPIHDTATWLLATSGCCLGDVCQTNENPYPSFLWGGSPPNIRIGNGNFVDERRGFFDNEIFCGM